MKFTFKHIVTAMALSLAMVSVAEAKKSRNYTNIKSMDQFNKTVKQKAHTVVLFFDNAEMSEKSYNKVKKAFDNSADLKLYTEQKNLQFLKVNTAYGDNHRIFEENKVLNDGTIAKKPVIFLFRNGKMIDNQLSGNITEKRIKRFVENYFKMDTKKTPKAVATKKMKK